MRILGYLSSVGAILLSMALPLRADQEKLVVSLPSFPPFAYKKENHGCVGSIVQIFKILAEEANVDIEINQYPYARILHSLGKGEIDAAIIFKNNLVASNVDYIGPISKSKVLVISDTANKITRYEDLTKLNNIGIIRKANYDTTFDQDSTLKKIQVSSYLQALKMFKTGRLDAVVGSLSGLEYAISKLNMDASLTRNAFHLSNKEWWLHVSKNSRNRQLIPQLEKAVKKIYKPDLSYQIFKQQQKQGCHLESH